MNEIVNHSTSCPYCGETIQLLIDCSVNEQRYIEDCEVCCQPMTIKVEIDENNGVFVQVFDENQA